MMWSVMRVKGGLLSGLRSSDTSKFLEEYIALHSKVTVYVNPCCFFSLKLLLTFWVAQYHTYREHKDQTIVPGSSCFNRLKTVENSKTVMLKTDCVRLRKVPTKRLWRGNFSVLDKWSLMGAGRLRNVVTHTGWTVLIVFVDQFKWNLSLVR